jgi:hypothetical protein
MVDHGGPRLRGDDGASCECSAGFGRCYWLAYRELWEVLLVGIPPPQLQARSVQNFPWVIDSGGAFFDIFSVKGNIFEFAIDIALSLVIKMW